MNHREGNWYQQVFCELPNLNMREHPSLMSREDHVFLAGLLQKERPKRILEVGVYWGGTTLLIMELLNELALSDTEVVSVDLAEVVNGKPVGCLMEENKEKLPNRKQHTLWTGRVVSEVIEEVTKEGREPFDLVIIDTAHYLPGEILDFLACYPFVAEQGVVVLHDVMLNNWCKNDAFATKVVFDTVVGEKYWNWEQETYPNIAAIRMTAETKRHIESLISSLSLSWHYHPKKQHLASYRSIIQKYYSKEAVKLFDKMVSLSSERFQETRQVSYDFLASVIRGLFRTNQGNVYIYGAGQYAAYLYGLCKRMGAADRICGFVVSDDQPILAGQQEVKHVSEIEWTTKDLILNSLTIPEVSNQLKALPTPVIEFYGIVREACNYFSEEGEED